MTTLIERETALAEWLTSKFPDLRVTGALDTHRSARTRGAVRTPEVRVVLHELTASGRARWRIQFAVADGRGEPASRIGSTGILANVQQFHAALAADTTPQWRSLGGGAHVAEDAFLWEETLEEVWSAPSRPPQTVFESYETYGFLAQELEAGSNDLGVLSTPQATPEVGDHVFARDDTGSVWLGTILTLTPTVTTSLASPRDVATTSPIYLLHEPVAGEEPAGEIATHSAEEYDRTATSLDGTNLRILIGPERFRLVLDFEAISPGGARDWVQYFRDRRERALFILGLADQSLRAVIFVGAETSSPRQGGPVCLRVTFHAEPLALQPELVSPS